MSEQRPVVIQFCCPNSACGKRRDLPTWMSGKRVRCRSCCTVAVIAPSSTDAVPLCSPPKQAGRPEKIGRFVILEELGEGGFGTVYRAHDPQLDRQVAVKIPKAGTLTTPNRVRRFHEDARSAAQLRHPNIVPVHDAGEADGYLFIASDFIEGRTLEEALAEKSLDRRRVVEIIRRLADALAYAHRQGVIHRDVKPSNVLLDAFEEPHLIDFGLAQRMTATPTPPVATDSPEVDPPGRAYIVGTPSYMAPEAAAGKTSEATPAMDQYSLGIVLYEALTGHPPFRGKIPMILHHQMHSPIPSPRETCHDLDLDLEAICLKALQKKPEDRYASCADFAEDLQRWLKGKIVSARKPGKVERLRRWAFREPMIASLVGAIALSLLLGMTASLAFAWSASMQAQRADENARVAEENARGQTHAREDAEKAEQHKTALLEQSLRNQYFDLIARAERELRDRHPAVARQLLHRAFHLKTIKGWEWGYLQAECTRTREVHLAPYSICLWQDSEKNEWLAWARGRDVICRRCSGDGSYWLRAEQNEKQVTAITASPQGKLLAVGYECGTVAIYEAESNENPRFLKVLFRYRHASPVTALAITDDGTLVWGCANGMVGRRLKGTTQPDLCHHWHTGQIRMLQFSPMGDQFVSCCSSATLRLSSTESLELALPRALESITAGNFVPVVLLSSKSLTPSGHAEDTHASQNPNHIAARNDQGGVEDTALFACLQWLNDYLSGWYKPPTFSNPPVVSKPPIANYPPDKMNGDRVPASPAVVVRPQQHPVPLKPMATVEKRPFKIPKYLILARSGGVISVLDLNKQLLASFQQHEADVIRVHCSLGTDRVATVDERGVCKLWRILNNETIELQTVQTDGGFALNEDGSALAWTEGDRIIKYRTLNGATRSFDRLTGLAAFADETSQSISSYPVYTHELAYANQGETLITGASLGSEQETSIQGELGIWKTGGNSPTLHSLRKASGPHTRTVTATADGQIAWAGDSPGVWLGTTANANDAQELKGHDATEKTTINVVRFSPDGSMLASAGTDHKLIIWDTKQRVARQILDLKPNIASSLAWSASGQKLYIGSTTGQMLIHPLVGAGIPDHFPIGKQGVAALACDGRDQYLVLGSDDGSITIRQQDQPGTEVLRIASAHRNGVLGLAFSPDGKRLASVGRDQMIRLWEVGTWQEALVVPHRIGLRGGIAFHPTGTELAVPTVQGVRLLTGQHIHFPADEK